jgi:voltage-gated potassium channel Kch
MIYVTGALIQFITFNELRELLGNQRMKAKLEQLTGHVIICGFGRIGAMLAQEMSAGRASFLILERSESRMADARERGFMCLQGDATEEATLRIAGVERARAVATVLPDDAANVFITLSARSLNPHCEIIARGEAPSTERKLRQAGANHVVMPAHIGAERIAEIILYPGSAAAVRAADRVRDFDRELNLRGLVQETLIAREHGRLAGISVGEAIARIAGDALVVALNRRGGEVLANPAGDVPIGPGDGVVLLCPADRAGALRARFEDTA